MTAQLLRLDHTSFPTYGNVFLAVHTYNNREKPILSHSVVVVSRDSAVKKCNQTIGAYVQHIRCIKSARFRP